MLLNLQFKHTSLVYIGVFLSSLSASVVLSYFIFPLFSVCLVLGIECYLYYCLLNKIIKTQEVQTLKE